MPPLLLSMGRSLAERRFLYSGFFLPCSICALFRHYSRLEIFRSRKVQVERRIHLSVSFFHRLIRMSIGLHKLRRWLFYLPKCFLCILTQFLQRSVSFAILPSSTWTWAFLFGGVVTFPRLFCLEATPSRTSGRRSIGPSHSGLHFLATPFVFSESRSANVGQDSGH